jgi:alanine racemase
MLRAGYNIHEVAIAMQADLLGDPAITVSLSELLTDSRQLINPSHTLFFALQSRRNDGHRFVSDLYAKGVKAFVVEKIENSWLHWPGVAFLKVNNSLEAMQWLTKAHRDRFHIPVIGITGSNGKTIVKEWLFQLLGPDHNIVRSPKSYNSQVGVPLSVWKLEERNDLAIFEAGISMPGEMERLQPLIRPTIGLITNIGQAHDENFTSLRQKTEEKLKLFTGIEILIYCSDYQIITESIQESINLRSVEILSWGRNENDDLRILKKELTSGKTLVEASWKTKLISLIVTFTDQASIENAIHCWAMMLHLGYDNEIIQQRISQLMPVAMRLELKDAINNCTLINDGYNSDIQSLSIALDFLNQQSKHPRKTLILSDILQSGLSEETLYRLISNMLKEKGIHRLIGIGPAISRQSELFDTVKIFFASTDDCIRSLDEIGFSNESILLKGARDFTFERIAKLLQQKAHETVLEIDLNNLVANLNYYRSKLPTGVKLMAMVKAFGYGSGGFEIAKILQFHHVDYLTVAYTDEGVELRNAGISLPIMVMSPEEQSLDTMLSQKLEPEIFSFRILHLLLEAIQRNQDLTNDKICIHLKLDTGMHRLGFMENELPMVIDILKQHPEIQVKTVFSHLASSDNPDHDDFTRGQIASFEKMCVLLCEQLKYPFDRHILNSSGISRFSESAFEMVRLGIGLYGVANTAEETEYLQTVLSLKSTITQIKLLPENESVGYNRSSYTSRPSRIGIVPIGYADGLSRLLSNGNGSLWVNGERAPIIGNVCMDMCMIDITGIYAAEGDEVVVFNAKHPIELIAKDSQTIPYEILTRISRRVKRVYFQE